MGEVRDIKLAVIGIRGFPGVQGGVESHCEQLIPRVSRRNIKVRVYRRKPYLTNHSRADRYPDIEFVDLPSSRIKGVEALMHTMLSVVHLLFHRVDIVNIHNIGPGMFAPLLRLAGMKVVLTYHSPNYEHKKWGAMAKRLLKFSEKISLKASHRIIFVSKFQRARYDERVLRKSVALPNGIDRHATDDSCEFVRELGITPGEYVLAVGRLTPEKGFDTLIQAVQKVAQPYKLVIAGSADHNPKYLDYLKSLDVNGRVVFAGFTTGSKLYELYEKARLYALSSNNEGFPMVLLEAMSFGLPIIASDIPAAHLIELPIDNYVEKANVDAFAVAIKRIIASDVAKVEYNLSDYDWDNIADRTIEEYRKALSF